MANLILFVLENNLVEQTLPFPKPDMENEAGMINNLSKVTEQYVAESRPVNSEGGNLELPGRIKSFVIHVPFAQKLNEKQ